MKSNKLFLILSLLLVALMVVACGGGGSETAVTAEPTEEAAVAEATVEETAPVAAEPAEEAAVAEATAEEAVPAAEEPTPVADAPDEISGTITVLTNRTDIVDTTFVDYAAQFNEIYPNITVEFEAMTDYVGEVKIRMNTEDYGDVLLIPDTITADQLPDFFSPLGTIEELDPIYTFVTEKSLDGQVYGLPVTGNAQGIVYNKDVFEAAGITELPTTPEEFLAAMQLIKDNTDAIPYYTNYAAGWPLVQWEGHRGSVSCDVEYSNQMVQMDAPFAEGTAHNTIYKLMYDLVEQGLVEVDPSTTDWESSKPMIANGEIGAMVLGSWAIVQMQEFADNPDVIGYMPFPSNMDGKICASAGGDYKIGINKNSENQEAARAWIDWFLNESNFAFDQGGIPPLKGSELPPQLAAFSDMNVEFIAQNPAPAGEEGLLDKIDLEAEIGLWEPTFRQRIIDAARGNTDETFAEIMADLDARWAEAQAAVVGQ